MRLLEKLSVFIAGAAALATVPMALFVLAMVGKTVFFSPDKAEITAEVQADTATETAQAATEAAPAPQPAAAPAAALVSAEAGEGVFRKCKACHTADKDGRHGTGPNLWNIVDRQIASAEGFAYSDALHSETGDSWTVERLDAFLANPRSAMPGNKMSFGGLKKEADRQNVIAFLAAQSDNPQSPADLGFASAPAGEAAAPAEDGPVEIDPVPWPEGVTYRDPAPRSAEAQAEVERRVAALQAEVEAGIDYERARYHPIHFAPLVSEASNEECLVCHQEIIDHKPREESPAGVPVEDSIAWYQTLDTYMGDQASFHWRHLESDFAKMVMNLECSFCHKGNDPREESPDMLHIRDAFTAPETPEFTLRKMINPSETCLLCHGAMPGPEEIMSLAGPWHEVREDMEWPEAPNGCLSCHAESFRTARHNVDYLKAHSIEEIARVGSSDTCYGCHGGRAWYRTSYPYARTPWPDMYEDEVPAWAEGRPTQSLEEYLLPEPQVAAE